MPFSNVRPFLVDSTYANNVGSMCFEEDFFGTDINRSVWDAGYYNPDWGTKNYDCTTYTDGSGVQRSVLRIWPQYDASLNPNVVESQNGFGRRDISTGNSGYRQKYGYFEASIKLCRGQGTFPAWWLINNNRDEIDIMEAYPSGSFGYQDGSNNPTDYAATTWRGTNDRDANWTQRLSATSLGVGRLDTGFHIYACLWTPSTMYYFFDGRLMLQHDHGGTLDSDMMLFLDLWFGSESGLPVKGQTPEGPTNSLEVDYVRCWLYSGAGGAFGPAAATGGGAGGTPTNTTGSTPVSGSTTPTAPVESSLELQDNPYGSRVGTVGPLTFRDEFTAFNSAAWSLGLWYAAEPDVPNWDVGNGRLRIWPTAEFSRRTFTTDGKFAQRYGYFEAAMKLNRGDGVWPAFWLYQHIDPPSGDRRPEIDIMEAYPGGGALSGWGTENKEPNNYGITLHKANADYTYHEIPFGQTLANYFPKTRLDDSVHVYGVKWTPDYIQFFFDGVELGPQIPNDYWHDSLYILFDLWYGSASGNPSAQTPLGVGNAFEILYCRAWGLPNNIHSVSTNLPSPILYGSTVTTSTTSNTYAAGDQFAIRYEAGTIKYLHNDTVKRTVTDVGTLQSFYFDSSFYSVGAKLQGVNFGRLGTVDWSSITGAGKPQDGATVGATLGTNVYGQITKSIAPTLIENKAITNNLIGDVIQSDGFVAGTTGWKIDKMGNVEFNSGIFRGTLAANIVRAEQIVSKSATSFEQATYSAPNNSVVSIPVYMDQSGQMQIVLVGAFSSSSSTPATDTASVTMNIDGGANISSSQTGYIPGTMTMMTGGGFTAGNHTVNVRLSHSAASGAHLAYLLILRSYR